jgi:hypothetical protein
MNPPAIPPMSPAYCLKANSESLSCVEILFVSLEPSALNAESSGTTFFNTEKNVNQMDSCVDVSIGIEVK